MSRVLHSSRDDRGVVAIELVMALPLLLMLLFGTVVVGVFFSVTAQTVGLARDGAREAALGKSTLPAGTEIVGTACPSPTDPTKFVTVQATKDVPLRSIPFLPILLPEEISETVTMRCGG